MHLSVLLITNTTVWSFYYYTFTSIIILPPFKISILFWLIVSMRYTNTQWLFIRDARSKSCWLIAHLLQWISNRHGTLCPSLERWLQCVGLIFNVQQVFWHYEKFTSINNQLLPSQITQKSITSFGWGGKNLLWDVRLYLYVLYIMYAYRFDGLTLT